MTALDHPTTTRITRTLAGLALAWAAAVAYAAHTGALARLYMPLIALVVAGSIALPTAVYARSPRLQAYARTVGLFPITALHAWRIPAALLFFWYGARGELPPAFWILAGVGDFVAGCLALTIFRGAPSERRYRFIHRFGFADFVVAVGTGLTFTLRQDPRMAPIAELPMALIPLFGVGISGATHLIAFDILRGRRAAPPAAAAVAHA